LDLLQTIRSRAEYSRLPVVVMSATDYQRESKLAGANGFVLKPFNWEDIATAIQEVLDRQKK
jgi:CheY-like chemotaxis protein